MDVGTRCWQLPPGGGLPRVYLELRAASLSNDGDRGPNEAADDVHEAAVGDKSRDGSRGVSGSGGKGGERGSTGDSSCSGGSGENRTARVGTGGSPLAAWLYKAEYRPSQAVSEGDAEGQEVHPAAGKPFATWLYKKAYCPPSPSAVLSSTAAPAVLEADCE